MDSPTKAANSPTKVVDAQEGLAFDPLVNNRRITKFQAVISPQLLLDHIPLTPYVRDVIVSTRNSLECILGSCIGKKATVMVID